MTFLRRNLAVLSRARSVAKSGAVTAVLLSAIFGLTLPKGAGAETVTLNDAYQRMMNGEIEFELLDIEDEIATELVKQAKGQRLPRVSLNFEATQVRQEIVSSDNEAFSEGTSEYPTNNVSLQISQPIFDQVKWRAMGVAQAQKALTTAKAEVARNQVTGLMVANFMAVARAQFNLQRSKAIVVARSQLESILRLQVDAGRVEADALIRAEGETFSARSDEATAELELSDALFELARFTGPEVTNVALSGNPFAVTDMRSLATTFSRDGLLGLSPDVQVARAELAVAEKERAQAVGARKPTANLVLDMTSEKTEGSLFGGGSEVQTTELGLQINVPIYEGGILKSKVREADARIKMAKLRVTQSEDMALRRYDSLLAASQRVAARAGAIGQQLRVAEEALTSATEKEKSGLVGAEVALEQRLRRDVLRIEAQASRLKLIEIQAEIYGLFGALDVKALSGQLDG